jgi:hypothetical protein
MQHNTKQPSMERKYLLNNQQSISDYQTHDEIFPKLEATSMNLQNEWLVKQFKWLVGCC